MMRFTGRSVRFLRGTSFVQIFRCSSRNTRSRGERRRQYERQRSPASANREIATLSRILSLAMDNGIVESNGIV